MRHLSILLLPLVLGVLVVSCTVPKPISREPAHNNSYYKVEYLFEHEGCKVYRFRDDGYYVYFTNCSGEAIARTDSTVIRNATRRSN